ncbi:hypothetical protein Tco_0070906 [Tanacetum coccineum]
MRTRSQARKRRQQQVPPNLVEPPKDTMAYNSNYGRIAPVSHRGIRGQYGLELYCLDKQHLQFQLPTPEKAESKVVLPAVVPTHIVYCPATDSSNYRENIQENVSQAAAVKFNQRKSWLPSAPPPMANQINHPVFLPYNTTAKPTSHNSLKPKQNVGMARTMVRSLPSNTVANPKGELKAITTRKREFIRITSNSTTVEEVESRDKWTLLHPTELPKTSKLR